MILQPKRLPVVRCSAWLGGLFGIVMLCLALLEMWDSYRHVAIIIGCTVLPFGLLCLIVAIMCELRPKTDQRCKTAQENESEPKAH